MMKVLIQHPQTLQFMKADSHWTPDANEAMNFQFALNAINHGVNRLKQPFLMFFKFRHADMDFTSYTYALEVPRPTGLLHKTLSGITELTAA